jgi:hypothetical protein
MCQTKNDNSSNSRSNGIEKTRVLLNIINDELSGKNSNEAKRIMDAVIQELVVAKEKEKIKVKQKEREMEMENTIKISDYDTDSLEKTKFSRKISSSPIGTIKSSSALSTVLSMDEKPTLNNPIIDLQINKAIKNKTIIKNVSLSFNNNSFQIFTNVSLKSNKLNTLK